MRQIWQQFQTMPISVKLVWITLIIGFMGGAIVIAGIPAIIIITAIATDYPQLLVLTGVFVVLLVIGYIKGRKNTDS